MKILKLYILLFFVLMMGMNCQSTKKSITISNDLTLTKLSPTVYVHTSYLQTQDFGKVGCNGMIYTNGKQAYIFDTPADAAQSKDLIHWLQKTIKVEIVGIVINHFHVDCLGGLEVFHQLNIPSYSSNLTQKLAAESKYTVPKNGFEKNLTLKLGTKDIVCEWFGEAHTKDNIIAWLPEEKTIFGGCMVKALGAGKGNLADANIQEWSATIGRIKDKYGMAKTIIPGHGSVGGVELLDYTITLFR